MVPWLFLHSLFIPSLPLMSLLSIFYFNNIILAALVSVPSIPYAYVWVALFNYRFEFVISTQMLTPLVPVDQKPSKQGPKKFLWKQAFN